MGKSLFTNYKFRASQIGHILTNTEKISAKELSEIKALESERDNGINANGNKVKWTDRKAERLSALITKRDKKEELPKGAISYLEDVFRAEFDGRQRQIFNKYMTKGDLCEEDSLQLLSDIDGEFYEKNEKYYENDFVCGTPDNVQFDVKDIKTNFDQDSFDNAELTTLYTWQVRTYLWLCGFTKGELVYCLVNNPLHQLENKKQHIWYQLGTPDDTDEDYIKEIQQLERNMIFDIQAWKRNYPNYDFYNTDLNFSISKIRRVKRFDVELLPEHIALIKKRVKMCREWLIAKEQEELAKIKAYSEMDYLNKLESLKVKSL